jgi:TPR repeat protein
MQLRYSESATRISTLLLVLLCQTQCPPLQAADEAASKPGGTNSAALVTWSTISNRWAAVLPEDVKRAAQSGEPTAQFYLSQSGSATNQTEKDAALKWLQAASDSGLACAQVELGYQHARGRIVKQDYAAAEKLYRLAAAQGHGMAMNNLGNLYLEGLSVPKNPTEAVKWFRKSAEQGERLGQANLGWAYENGVGVERNRAEAELWMRKAAEQELPFAQFTLGRMAERQPKTGGSQTVAGNYQVAAEWYQKAAEQGHVQAMIALADLYYYGHLERNYPEAVKWYKKAAESGAHAAVIRLAELYADNHEKFPANLPEAIRWYRVAAGKDDEKAQYKLGCLLLDPKSGQQDRAEAEKWLTKAAENGFAEARLKLASIRNQSPDAAAAEMSRDELEVAAYRGEGQTRLLLGKAYEEGIGGPVNLPAAAKMYWWTANIGPEKDRPEALRRVVKLYATKKVGFDTTETILPKSREEFARLIESYHRLIPPGETEFEVSNMFLSGEMLPEDKPKAIEWLTRSAKNGSAAAMNQLGDFWTSGLGGQTNLQEAVRWYSRAATNGLASAQLNLARAYQNGLGSPLDLVEATAWLQVAAAQMNPEAILRLTAIESRLSAEQRAEARRRSELLNKTLAASKQINQSNR